MMLKNKRKINSKKREQGFTLVEIMVAVALLLIGLLGVAQMQIMNTITNSTANQRTTAITLAQDQIELLRSRPYANIGASPFSDTSGMYTRSWTVANDTPAVNMSRVTVTVSWKGKQVQLQSIIANGL
jgi:type IV pilus assembly protein PilV